MIYGMTENVKELYNQNTGMNYLAIGLTFLIIIILYNVYYYVTNNTLTSGLQTLNTQLTFTYDKLINPNSNTYSYQCWLYISSPTAVPTQIFYRGNNAGASSYSEFEVDISGQELILLAGTGTTSPPSKVMTITTNFPIQKWVYLVINVYNVQTFEAYLNGKLTKTVNVSNATIPTSKTSTLYVGNTGLTGYTSKFTRIPSTIDAQTVWQNYLNGNGLSNIFSTLMPYGLNMSISKGEELQRVIQVF